MLMGSRGKIESSKNEKMAAKKLIFIGFGNE